MKEKRSGWLLKCIAALLAAAFYGILILGAFNSGGGKDDTCKVVCMGDSNFGNIRDETGIVSILGERLGQKTVNGAFGGTTMTAVYGTKTQYQNVLSMYQLAISICNKNFGVQKASIEALNRGNFAEDYEATLDMLAQVDFDKTECLIIEHGVNDYLSGVPIKNDDDPYDTDTFSGTLRTIISMLKKEYPKLRIVLVTPGYCAPTDTDGSLRYCDETDYGGGFLEDYVLSELAVAKEMDVEIIDLYHGIDMKKDNVGEYLYDSLHFNEYGRKLVADMIADYLLGEDNG